MTYRLTAGILTLVLLYHLPARSEVLDRVVIVVSGRFIITLSDIRKERAIETALGTDSGNEDSIGDLLVEKHLLEEQIAQSLPIEVEESEVSERLSKIRVPEGVTYTEIRGAIEAELRRSAFMELKFGQFIRISDEEMAQYYESTLVPELQRRGEPVPPLEEVAPLVRQYITKERMFDEFDAWLAELKKRTTIEKILY